MEKVRIGIVGLNFGSCIVDLIRDGGGREYFTVAGVCDLDLPKAQQLATRIGARAYRDLDELLADASIPAIGLFTPPSGRAKLISKIIRAGKDVLTTKPFESDVAAATAVLAEARQLGRVLHMNSPAPTLTPDLRQIKMWREQYPLGQPVACRADTWVRYPNDKADGSWYDDPRRCPVAPIFRLGIYTINDLIGIFGPAKQVQVMHSRVFTGRPTPDNAQLSILFENGGLANVFASFCVNDGDKYRGSLALNFENGTIYRNCGPVRTEGYPAEMSLIMTTDDKRQIIGPVRIDGMSGNYQWDMFYRAVRGEKIVEDTTPEQIVAGIKILNAMARAEQSGATESVT